MASTQCTRPPLFLPWPPLLNLGSIAIDSIATDCHRLPPIATDCHRLPPIAIDFHRFPSGARYGLLLLILRFLQWETQEDRSRGSAAAAASDIERCLGARLVKLLDFYGRAFDPRNMGVSVCRNRGEGEFLIRDHSSRVRVDLSQLHLAQPALSTALNATQPGWVSGALATALTPSQQQQVGMLQPRAANLPAVGYPTHSGRPRPASEAGDWCPPLDPSSPSHGLEHPLPAGLGAQPAANTYSAQPGQGYDWPLHRPRRTASTVAATHRWRQGHLTNNTAEWAGEGQPPATRFWFDPLYVEDPLRPSNNVGRNCFRISAIQQEFQKAHQLCTMHPGATVPEGDYPILGRLCKLLPS